MNLAEARAELAAALSSIPGCEITAYPTKSVAMRTGWCRVGRSTPGLLSRSTDVEMDTVIFLGRDLIAAEHALDTLVPEIHKALRAWANPIVRQEDWGDGAMPQYVMVITATATIEGA